MAGRVSRSWAGRIESQTRSEAGFGAHGLLAEDGARVEAEELTLARTRIAELERVIGRQQVDLDFFREALRLMDATLPSATATNSTRSSKR
jgi:hypothetical protein